MKIYEKIIFFTVMMLIWSYTVSYGFNHSQVESAPSKKTVVSSETKTRTEVWQVIINMNYCRLEGDPKGLSDYLHPNIVAIMPGTGKRLEGREACITTWTDSSRPNFIHYCKENDTKIDIYNNTAVVIYNHDIFYIIDTQGIHASHRDMVVLIKESGKWLVVAYHSSPFPRKLEAETLNTYHQSGDTNNSGSANNLLASGAGLF